MASPNNQDVWVEHKAVYYYNKRTRKSSWTKPASGIVITQEEEEAERLKALMQQRQYHDANMIGNPIGGVYMLSDQYVSSHNPMAVPYDLSNMVNTNDLAAPQHQQTDNHYMSIVALPSELHVYPDAFLLPSRILAWAPTAEEG